jgi:hypothetical protein
MEAQLVDRYRRWLDLGGVRLNGLVIPTSSPSLRADLYDTQSNTLIETKAESSREHIRYAIGQPFDYRRYLKFHPDLAVLFPDLPTADMAELLSDLHITIIWQQGDGF